MHIIKYMLLLLLLSLDMALQEFDALADKVVGRGNDGSQDKIENFEIEQRKKQLEIEMLCSKGIINAIESDDYSLAGKWCPDSKEYMPNTYSFLGRMYYQGKGVKKDYEKAYTYASRAAEDGDQLAQYLLGVMYKEGRGVKKSIKKSNRWLKRSALQGNSDAQKALGVNFFFGNGVSIDYVESYKWINLANSSDKYDFRETLNKIGALMTKKEVALAQQKSREFVAVEEKWGNRDAIKPGELKTERIKTGTGFVLNSKGHVATSYHVVDDCQQIKAKRLPKVGIKPWHIDWDTGRTEYINVKLLSYDKANDLAILAFPGEYENYVYLEIKNTPQLGSQIVVAGFPVPEVLSDDLRISVGEINSLEGIKGDDTKYQISASIQKGNSGGPLLNKYGNVIGVIHSTIDTGKFMKYIGDVPQNLNFAVDIKYLVELLESSKITFNTGEQSIEESIDSVASNAKRYTTIIECWGY
ncbi:MAG: tetratricopeptide repeat-containing serine protease family protein [Candidatus Thiodiazotropha taylori]